MAYKHWKDMTDEEKIVAKEKREEKLKATIELLENGIKGIITSDQWKNFLLFSTKFYKYSFRNQMLIWMQKPTATMVGSFFFWRRLKRMPRKGTGLSILCPIIKKVDVVDKDGNEYKADRCVGFRIGHVFDVGDTDGEPLSTEVTGISLLKGNDIDLYEALCKYSKEKHNIDVKEVKDNEIEESVNGCVDYKEGVPIEIKIKGSNAPTMKAKTMAHELTHAALHKPATYFQHSIRSLIELEAESVAFMVMHNFGIDSGEYSFLYLASWGGGEEGIEIIKTSGKKIQETARDIITWIEETYGIVNLESEPEEVVSDE